MKREIQKLREKISDLIKEAMDILLPRYCIVCGQRLKSNEPSICIPCLQSLPSTRQKDVWDNLTVRLFWGKAKIEKGFSLLYYHRYSDSQHIFSQMKYEGRDDLCRDMGRMLAYDAGSKGFFEDIEVIVPVPLHHKRQKERGYNQSEHIARGISSVTGIPVNTQLVKRVRNTKSQVTMNAISRRDNIQGAFEASNKLTKAYKHILVVDDTITTGSTVQEVLNALQGAAPDCHFSVCSIGLAGHSNN